jgi:ketosteroid isomerase-like protein
VPSQQVVRKPLRAREPSGRPLDQRIAMRFPRLTAAYARLIGRLPPTSPIRKAVLSRTVQLNVDAFNRRDFAALLLSYHPAAEFHVPRELAESGIVQPLYRGGQGYVAFFRDWLGAWGNYRMRPKEFIDLGDRVVVIDEIVGHGAGSGAPVAQEHAIVLSLKDGRAILSREYFDPAEALEAVGLAGADIPPAPASDQVVRRPLRVREPTTRTLDQRIWLRFPGLTAPLFRLVDLLPPSSRMRQALLWRTVQTAFEAYNRRDLDVVAIGFHPDLEYYPYREFVEAGLTEPCYHGPAGYRAYIESTYEVWGTEVRIEPLELIDLGDRLVLLGDMPMRARASGVPLAETYACVVTLRGGRVVRQQDFLDHAEALEAAGLQSPSPSASRA